jgi:hypothetical protein
MLPRSKTYSVAANNLTIADPQADHVTGIQKGKMFANGIHPDQTWELWIADRNVAGDALRVTIASPVAEDGRHMQHDMLAVLVERGKSRDAWHSAG